MYASGTDLSFTYSRSSLDYLAKYSSREQFLVNLIWKILEWWIRNN